MTVVRFVCPLAARPHLTSGEVTVVEYAPAFHRASNSYQKRRLASYLPVLCYRTVPKSISRVINGLLWNRPLTLHR
ncbi:hypothetical protein BS17DRAFT_771634 [Gyrodon lividus]|nr:hypothetical protein BS17DRAFT_771634 [Gyrodon lividus]